MSTLYTRRTALTALGMGAATLLAACSSNSSESSSSPSATTASSSASTTPSVSAAPTPEATTTVEPGPSMKGEVVLADYSSTGTFEAGTKEHKAQNVPVPLEPAKPARVHCVLAGHLELPVAHRRRCPLHEH